MGKPNNKTTLVVALVGVGLFMFGCGPEAPDTCQMAQSTLQNCQVPAPDGFLNQCYSRPAKFQEILTTPCDVLANQTRGTQSWNGEGDGCNFNWTCGGDLVCVPTKYGEKEILEKELGYMVGRMCLPPRDVGQFCDDGNDCRDDLWCRPAPGENFPKWCVEPDENYGEHDGGYDGEHDGEEHDEYNHEEEDEDQYLEEDSYEGLSSKCNVPSEGICYVSLKPIGEPCHCGPFEGTIED